MIGTVGSGTGGNFGDFKKDQHYLYTNPAIGMGKGARSDPN
jgi:hypothetical protein